MVKKKGNRVIKNIALIGIMAALIECAKLALAAFPNIEAVSLLISLFSYVFGWVGVVSALIFVCIEPAVWGMGTWFVSYLIYWPLLAMLFMLLGKVSIKNRFILSASVVGMTFLFGILTSLVDVGLFSGSFDRFFYRFGIYYARGAGFYAVHIISNALVFLFAFKPLSSVLRKIKLRLF